MAATFDGGVVLAADSRTSSGRYVANRATAKVTQIAENVYVCRSGAAADTQAVAGYVQYYIAQHQAETARDVSVQNAANLTRQLAYQNKEMLSCGMIVAGWDAVEGGTVYALPMGGTLIKVPFAIGGSGSAYITGYCDKYFKSGMSKEDCKNFVSRAVSHAMSRDGSSGGCIRMVVIDKDGPKVHFTAGNAVPQHGGDKGVPLWSGFSDAVAMTT